MKLLTAIKERRSCRTFSPEPLSEEAIETILDAAVWAPSPLNAQPWEFIVITSASVKEKITAEAKRCCRWAVEKSGWKWLSGYKMDFLRSVPAIIAVVGNPQKTGVDQFMADGSTGYQHACAAAIQNMLLAAHAEGLGGLWFTFYDKKVLAEILAIGQDKQLIALVCIGKADDDPPRIPRKNARDKTTYIR